MFYWSVCTKPEKSVVMYMYARVSIFASFYDLAIGFWICSDSAVYCILVLMCCKNKTFENKHRILHVVYVFFTYIFWLKQVPVVILLMLMQYSFNQTGIDLRIIDKIWFIWNINRKYYSDEYMYLLKSLLCTKIYIAVKIRIH
jgi:hypothetical protein